MIEPLDYEVSHEYYITVEATDGGSPPLSDMATVNINLTDVNDNRPAFSQDVYTAVVSEDAELGKIVMTVRRHRDLFFYVQILRHKTKLTYKCLKSERYSLVFSTFFLP